SWNKAARRRRQLCRRCADEIRITQRDRPRRKLVLDAHPPWRVVGSTGDGVAEFVVRQGRRSFEPRAGGWRDGTDDSLAHRHAELDCMSLHLTVRLNPELR